MCQNILLDLYLYLKRKMNESKVNPKKLVIDYIDSLKNKVDINTEEQLQKFSSSDVLEVKSEFSEIHGNRRRKWKERNKSVWYKYLKFGFIRSKQI